MKDFITRGGLPPLVLMAVEENLYLRGQVLEILLAATDCDTYDWFRPHAEHSSSDRELHSSFYQVARSPYFFAHFFANRTDSYPGGSFRALQLIAFALSWLRALYTKDQKLSLSAGARRSLRLWAAADSSKNAPSSSFFPVSSEVMVKSTAGEAVAQDQDQEGEKGKGDGQEGDQGDPEAQLAKTLYEDFTGEALSDFDPAAEPAVISSDVSAASVNGIGSILDESLLRPPEGQPPSTITTAASSGQWRRQGVRLPDYLRSILLVQQLSPHFKDMML